MRAAVCVRPAGLFAAILASLALGASCACAQDVGNGLWQDYRYPAANPNWRAAYEREVATWGENPQALRPRYNSSPDMMWGGNAASLPTTPFLNQPYYTVSHWEPYVPRPVDWDGLHYSGGEAPPETTTGNHAWYGPNSPGPRGYTPAEWVQWEMNTPEGERYRELSGLGGPPSRRPGTTTGVAPKGAVPREKSALKQYFRSEPGKAGKGRWQEREGRVPPETSELPARDEGASNDFKQYILNRPAAVAKDQARQLRVVRPKAVTEVPPARIVTPAPEHNGFTQYYLRSTPGGTRHWEVKSKKPATEP